MIERRFMWPMEPGSPPLWLFSKLTLQIPYFTLDVAKMPTSFTKNILSNYLWMDSKSTAVENRKAMFRQDSKKIKQNGSSIYKKVQWSISAAALPWVRPLCLFSIKTGVVVLLL